jgi:hypothetical protein
VTSSSVALDFHEVDSSGVDPIATTLLQRCDHTFAAP